MTMRLRFTLLFLLCALTLPVLSAQQPSPPADAQQAPPVTFHAEVNYVEVDAVVTDAKGNMVSDLTAGDFEVLEDRKAQKVTAFGLVNIPVTRADQPLYATAPTEPDVQSNHQVDGRVYLLVLDSLHTDPLNALRVKAAARQFVERRLGTNDVAAVVHTSGRSDLGQDFTTNRRLLMAAIDRFVGDKLRSATLERADAYGRTGLTSGTNPINSTQQGITDPYEMERGAHARSMLTYLRRLSDFMAGVRGRRKAMILISEGLAYDMSNLFGTNDTSMIVDEMRDTIGAATRANVSIFAIDPRGLATGVGDAIEIEGFPDTPPITDSGDSGGGAPNPRSLGIGLQSMMSEARLSQDSLRMLAEDTGGFAAVNRNDFKDVFERVVRENSTYYVLGYYSTNEKRDGKFRTITLRVKSRPGLTIRARRGYVAPRGKAPEVKPAAAGATSAVLREALNSPLPVGGIPMAVFAAPFKGAAPNATVVVSVELKTNDFKYTEKDGALSDLLDVVVTPVDRAGVRKPAQRSTITLAFKPATRDAANANGIRVLSALDLPPGGYQLRVTIGERGSDRAGTVLYDIEVPDFSKALLTMSGIAVTANSSTQAVTVGSEGTIAPLLRGPTTAAREFGRGDTLALFAEIYENAPGVATHKLDLTTTVKAEGGRTVFQSNEERSSTELQAGRGGYGYASSIPLKDFTPGLYVIHVEARSRTSSKEAGIGRDIQIRVK